MKLYLISLVFFVSNFLNAVHANEYFNKYSVSTAGIKIGKFSWSLVINGNEYISEIKLENSGILSPLYKFRGNYISTGIINHKNNFESKSYKQNWQTKKRAKVVDITFDRKVVELKQQPKELEFSRVNINDLIDYYDPITSFINILNGAESAKTIDGRRIYVMKKDDAKDSGRIVLKIDEYKNIWADHKRNDLEIIEFVLSGDNFLPEIVSIHFKERVFLLSKI